MVLGDQTLGSKNMFVMYLYANFIFLVFAWSAKQIYENDGECHDEANELFLYWICYGNLIIYAVVAVIFLVPLIKIRSLSLADIILNKIGAVCVTILTFILVGCFVLYNFVTMGVGIYQFFHNDNTCKEVELFVMGTGYTMLVQAAIQLIIYGSLCFKRYTSRNRLSYRQLIFGGEEYYQGTGSQALIEDNAMNNNHQNQNQNNNNTPMQGNKYYEMNNIYK